MTTMDKLVLVGLCLVFVGTASAQDPKVNITETDPVSEGFRVKGIIARDVTLNCFVENLPRGTQVRWKRTTYDQHGNERVVQISVDMAVEDNNKWSIEKPTQISWRLRIKALEETDQGNYTCHVVLTGNNNRVESNRTVLAYSPPIIVEELSSSDVTVKEGDFVPMRCNASGLPQPTIIWRRQGNNILPGGGVVHLGSILDVHDIEYTARGLYICEALNDMGVDRRDITLTIQHVPKVFAAPEEVGQKPGYQRTLTCNIESNPMPRTDEGYNQVWWMKGPQSVQDDGRREFRFLVGAYNRLTAEMVIFSVQSGDFGSYTCHASTNLGSGQAQVTLYETDEPQEDKRNSIIRGSASAAAPTLGLLLTALTLLRI